MIFLQVFVNMLKFFFLFPLFFSAFISIVYSQNLDTLRGNLDRVEVVAKNNPAVPIIKKTIQNRNGNGQFSNKYFSYVSYQKMIFTGDIDKERSSLNKVLQLTDSLPTDTLLSKTDSGYLKTIDFLNNHHLFFMETVTKSYFKRPAVSYEKVVAHRTAGLQDPIVSVFLAKQQTINFYERDFINIFEANFVNPISANALTIYDFYLEEKLIQGNDTVYMISFKPKENVHFKSLTGKIWITADNFAFTKIEVAPFDKSLGFSFELLQEYEKQQNQTYFLKNMFFRVDLKNMGVTFNHGNIFVKPALFSEKRISNIDYQTHLRNTDFGLVDIDEEVGDLVTQERILAYYRPINLTDKELNTLVLIDSLAKPFRLDRKLESLKILITGKLPISFFNINIRELLQFNSTEAVRLGVGIYTNDRLSKIVHFGGFFGYGFKDRKLKWGGELGFIILRSREFKVTLHYYSNLIESGGTLFFDRDYTLFSGEFYRSWLFERFCRSHALGLTAQSRITRWLTGYVSTYYSANKTLFEYSFQNQFSNGIPTPYSFDDFYIKIGVRLAFKEHFWGAEKYYFYAVSPYPIIIIQYSRGIKGVMNSSHNYNRIDLKVRYRKDWKILGFTNITLYAGYVDCPLPYPLLFNQRAGYYPIGMDGAEQFGVMRPDEFLSDKYVSVFIRHNFGRMTQNKKFSPRIIFCQNIGFGGIRNPDIHKGIRFKTMEKGYFESGLMIGDLLVIKGVISFGVGVFVRYGTYFLPKPQYKTIDNFAFKISVRVPFER